MGGAHEPRVDRETDHHRKGGPHGDDVMEERFFADPERTMEDDQDHVEADRPHREEEDHQER